MGARVRFTTKFLACTALGGTLLANGCFARLETGLDLVLAPAATGNLLRLPYTVLAPLAPLFGSLFGS